jgi:hypothetical protein
MVIIKMIKGNALYAIAHVIHVMDLMPQIVCHAIPAILEPLIQLDQINYVLVMMVIMMTIRQKNAYLVVVNVKHVPVHPRIVNHANLVRIEY